LPSLEYNRRDNGGDPMTLPTTRDKPPGWRVDLDPFDPTTLSELHLAHTEQLARYPCEERRVEYREIRMIGMPQELIGAEAPIWRVKQIIRTITIEIDTCFVFTDRG